MFRKRKRQGLLLQRKLIIVNEETAEAGIALCSLQNSADWILKSLILTLTSFRENFKAQLHRSI